MLRSSNLADNRLEAATRIGNYNYWLTQEDIADIARLEYAGYRTSETADTYKAFEIIGSPAHMQSKLQTFITKASQVPYARLTLIVNVEQLHWITLTVVSYHGYYEAYYIDSLKRALPSNYQEILESSLHLSVISVINLNGYFREQEDDYNCGLWALENAHDLTRMTDEAKGLLWMSQRLQRPRNLNYFTRLRLLYSLKLADDPARKVRVIPLEQQLLSPGQEINNRLSPTGSDLEVPKAKKQKLLSEQEKVKEQFEFFVIKFLQNFVKRLGAHAVMAKGERLTADTLKAELKLGATGALLGAVVFQNIGGTIPSLVASLRSISSKYYTNKKMSQKITKYFSELKSGDLSKFLIEAAVEIFQSYEQQFMQITDKAGIKIAIEKLAEDAAGRSLNYIDEKLTPTTSIISSELIAFGILSGKSETFFDPSLKKVRVRISGSRIQNAEGNSFSTASLFEKVGLVIKDKNNSPDMFYKKAVPHSARYGYRRLLSWEKDSEGQLKAIYQANYIPENQAALTTYEYQLNPSRIQQEIKQILEKISHASNLIPPPREVISPKNILFNLRRSIKNFSGRTLALTTLHQLLGSGTKSAVVTQKMAQLSLNPAQQSLQEGMQTAVSGMGGIGKTQLALEYARQYAADYDHNVLWIDAEKKSDILDYFKKLAIKLTIDHNDAYNNEKESSQLIEEVYSYFGNAKSLFIFDNVENIKEIEDILPKASSKNNPTVLITSRHSNWKNIATPLALDVFTETESSNFIKAELALTDAETPKIKELTQLLQNLPLALQQAVAYIKNEKNLDNKFTIQHYIDCFKQKSQEVLAFDFSSYSNDPYSKTVLTTWEITLEKLKQEKFIGESAIITLQIMAYLNPDNISNTFFLPLLKNEYLSATIQLLKNYSLINEGSESNISTVHRLVQKVLRINLERNRSDFMGIVHKIIFLTKDFYTSKEIMSHYYSFLLHMTQHKELTAVINLQASHKDILEVITHFEDDKSLLFNLFDAAQLTLTRENYLNFIGEALIIYMYQALMAPLVNVVDYIEKNMDESQISLAEAKHILSLQYSSLARSFIPIRFSSDPAINARQRNAVKLVDLFMYKIFSKASICRRNRKRSVNTLCSVAEDERLIPRPLDDSKVKAVVKKVGLVANLVNSLLLSKDTLSALIQGDFESVAITFTLLSSSRILGKISNKLLTKGGELLASGDEKLLFQKELDYDAKLAVDLFTDKEIMLAGKRRFLGSAMKAAAPFVARGSALFFAYNFVKGLSSNETNALTNLSNGAIVALDIGEAGVEAAEYLGYIAGASEVTGPIGEGLSLLIIGGMQLYHVEKELKAIEKWVHLSDREKFAEGMRTFFNFQPSEYLEAKANNQQLTSKAIAFLKLHSEIQRYVFSAWLPATALAKKNFVFLDHKRNLIVFSDNIPEEPRAAHFFCLPGVRVRSHTTSWIEEHLESLVESELLGFEEGSLYLCVNAIGVEYNVNRTGNATLIALQGNAMVIGSDSDTIFLINDGDQDYRAGDADDLFILQGKYITGKLQGGLGVNIVKFSEYQPAANESVLLDSQGFLCGKNVTINSSEEFCVEGLQLSNITQLHGRKNKQDKTFPIANLTLVDTYAGESAEKPDFIYITEKSSKNLNIVVRPHTVVHLLPRNTTDNSVTYTIPADQIGTASIQLPFNEKTLHQFYFESPLADLKAFSIINNTIAFQFSYPEGCFNLTIQNTDDSLFHRNASTTEKSFFIQNTSYIFNKSLGMKLFNEKTLYTQWYGNNSIDEIILFVAPIAHHLDKAMVIQTAQNVTIAIGGRQQEILSTDGSLVNHLVGNAGDTVYVIQAPKNLTDPFPLKDISLYQLENDPLITTTTTDTLDLREIFKKAQDQCSASSILPSINENNKDLIIYLYANYYFSASGCIQLAQNSYRIAEIILKNALINYWYQNLDIILDEHQHPMNIIFDEDKWKLAPIPLVFMGNKNIIVIPDEDIKQNEEVFILKNTGEYRFIRHNDTDLLVTNLFNNATEAELYTVLFSNFFKCVSFQEKILSLRLNFLDESLTLKEHTQEINNATDFYRQIQSYFNTTQVFFNESGIFFNESAASIPRTRRDIATLFPAGSGSARVVPGVYDALTYLRFKMLQLVSLVLNSFKPDPNNDFNLNDVEDEESASIKTIYAHELPKKETNPPVYCNQKNFFSETDCVKNQSDLGLLGYCANPKQVLVWFKKTMTETVATSRLSWFAISYQGVSANLPPNHLNTSDINLSLAADDLFFSNKDGCHQVLNLHNMSNTSLVTLFPYLPEQGKQWLLAQWRQEKNRQDEMQPYETALELFKQSTLQIGWNYIGNAGLLHTFVGDYFQAAGLRPNWQEHDPNHFLARWLSAIQQWRLGGPHQTSTMLAALLETAFLHPKLQLAYSFFLPNTKNHYKKQALRFCADLLQWGSLNFALLPSLLDMLFSDYLLIAPITWGLRAVLSFYMLNNDPSYYYLGIALFFSPQLPSLLEHLGIPVTAYVSKTLEKLAQLFIFQSLLEELRPAPDENRLAQSKLELQTAEQRVVKGNTRVAAIVKPLNSFFKPVPKPYFNQQEDQPKSRYSMH
jgi:NB-ARC domain